MDQPEKGLPRAMVGSVLLNGTMGFAYLVTALSSSTGFAIIEISFQSTSSLVATDVMTATIVGIAGLGSIGLFASSSRTVWVFARDRGFPFSEPLSKVIWRHQVLIFMVLPVMLPATPANVNYASLIFGAVLIWIMFDWFRQGQKGFHQPAIYCDRWDGHGAGARFLVIVKESKSLVSIMPMLHKIH